jgi:hypothetical protein
MTYQIGGLVTASDLNEILNGGTIIPIPVGVNHLWNDGTIGGTMPGRNYGYGQGAQPVVVVGELISAGPIGGPTEWQKMIRNINTMAAHQGTTVIWAARHPTFPPVTTTVITWETTLATNIALISANRFNSVAQGATTATPVTSTTTWSDKLTATFTVTFASDVAIRSYFNSGGQFGISASHPAGVGIGINQIINDLCADLGTILFSAPSSGTASIAGTSYNGVTQSGGYPAGSTISTNSGFYAQTTTPIEIAKQLSNSTYGTYGPYGNASFVSVSASYNGTGVLTFTVVIDEVPNGALVTAGTTISLTTKPPSTAILTTNTWGTPTIASSVITV